jgi:hypothetical protein
MLLYANPPLTFDHTLNPEQLHKAPQHLSEEGPMCGDNRQDGCWICPDSAVLRGQHNYIAWGRIAVV